MANTDGGGVRGLSSLFLLKRVMDRVKFLLESSPENNPILKVFSVATRASPLEADSSRNPAVGSASSEAAVTEVLPCYFFDYMIGTSTGGYVP